MCLHCVYWRVASSRGVLPQTLATLRSACDKRRQPAEPAGRHETRRETVETSRRHSVVSFPRCWRAKHCEEETAKSVLSGAAWTPDRTFKPSIKPLCFLKKKKKFWPVLVELCSHFRRTPSLLVSLCALPNQTAIVVFKYIQMALCFPS